MPFVHLDRGVFVVPLAVVLSATAMLWRDRIPRAEPALAAAAAVRDDASDAPSRVRCRIVRAEDGQAIANAHVELMQDDLCVAAPDPVPAAGATDADGWVRFDAAGKRCRLRVYAEGFAPETGAVFEVGAGTVEQRIALWREAARPR